jgi:hypothetical protein
LCHHIDDEPRQIVLWQPFSQAGWQLQVLIPFYWYKIVTTPCFPLGCFCWFFDNFTKFMRKSRINGFVQQAHVIQSTQKFFMDCCIRFTF